MRLQTGDLIGSYKIENHLGQGGMATVFKAHHEKLDRYVAIKLMHETFLQDEDFRTRFQREAQIVAKLEHPNIVPIYDYNEHEGIPFLVMKYVDGMTLKRYAIKTGLTLEDTRDFLMSIAEGLDYAHEKGILHRDMKPSNILINSGNQPFITDFGLARMAEMGASTISTDMMLGTPFYISPEQAQGSKDLDSRTDIYSLGVILYEFITGRVPFEGDTPYIIVNGHINATPTTPSDINPDLSPEVDDMMDRALAKKPSDRFPTAKILIQAFADAIANTDSKVFPKPANEQPLAARPRFNDLGTAPPQEVAIPSAIPRTSRQSEFEVNLGEINFSQLGKRFKTGVANLAEMIEDRIDTELRQRLGLALTEEELVRRKVAKRMKARQEFIANLTSYLTVNSILLAIWFFTGAGFFWPFFSLFFWGIAVIKRGSEYYSKYGPGAQRTEAQFEAEVQREMLRNKRQEKSKIAAKAKQGEQRLSLEDLDAKQDRVRLNDEGELTDSFIGEQRRHQ
ncbi:MAG: protein kinase [Anaerolineae bacterium]|nr:protein kinase [Anaerolineae bacterium]MDQ7037179.1 protein kinase [Anaerolineae bacterium]